jgi:hypothetical protein
VASDVLAATDPLGLAVDRFMQRGRHGGVHIGRWLWAVDRPPLGAPDRDASEAAHRFPDG